MLRLVDQAVPIIIERGIPSSMQKDFDSTNPESLRRRLVEVCVRNPAVHVVTIPLLLGLIQGGEFINTSIECFGSEESFPILHWICQYTWLKATKGYTGGNDIVGFAIRAGADVNGTIPSGNSNFTAIFFAVKYGDIVTVDLLLEAGADVHTRDRYGQTCIKSAIEHPQPAIIERLCSMILPETITESIALRKSLLFGDKIMVPPGASTLPDFMLKLLFAPTEPITWQVKGVPKVDDYVISLLRLMQHGARFSPDNKYSNALAFCYHVLSRRLALNDRISSERVAIILGIRMALFGEELPRKLRDEARIYASLSSQQSSLPNFKRKCGSCSICRKANNKGENHVQIVALACHHTYCLACLRGSTTLGLLHEEENNCAICKRHLYREHKPKVQYVVHTSQRQPEVGLVLMKHAQQERSPSLLNNTQLDMECHARHVRAKFRYEKIAKLETQVLVRLPEYCKLELSATKTAILASEMNSQGMQYLAPRDGPVVIPIVVQSIPVLAWLSPSSPLTCVSKNFCKTFCLELSTLVSNDFCAFNGQSVGMVALVKEFGFKLGDVDVCLNNAICLLEEANPPIIHGVQLGMDFFDTALWTQCCTVVDVLSANGTIASGEARQVDASSVVAIADGSMNTCLIDGNECICTDGFRYYARNGKSFETDFIHIPNLAESESIPIISLRCTKQFQMCHWCGRVFPSTELLACIPCAEAGEAVYFCDSDCQTKASMIHEHGGVNQRSRLLL